jgi:Rieske Fe-S protein
VRRAVAPHQRDFPYERGEEAHVTRREFCNFLALTSTALFVSAAGLAGKAALDARTEPHYAPKRIEGAQSLAPGSSLNFRYPNEDDTAILVRLGEDQFFAYGQKCTHLACPVYFEQRRQRLECPCHEGGFDVQTGNVLYGPPPRPLDQIILEMREDGEVWAVGRKASGHERSV